MYEWELFIRESVRQTLADYTTATDRFDLPGVAACFAPAGVLEFTGGDEPLAGPSAIEAGLAAALGKPRDSSRASPTFVRHHVSSIRFGSVTAERVEVSSYFAVYTDIGLDHWGGYRDVLAVERGCWLFTHRRVSVDAFAANSLMAV